MSEAAEILGYRVVGILVPASWDGGNLGIQVDPTGAATFYAVHEPKGGDALEIKDPGASHIVMTTGADKNQVSIGVFIAGHSVKVTCASNVAADRTLILLCVAL